MFGARFLLINYCFDIAWGKAILVREECGGMMCFCKVRLEHFLLQESFWCQVSALQLFQYSFGRGDSREGRVWRDEVFV